MGTQGKRNLLSFRGPQRQGAWGVRHLQQLTPPHIPPAPSSPQAGGKRKQTEWLAELEIQLREVRGCPKLTQQVPAQGSRHPCRQSSRKGRLWGKPCPAPARE